MRYQLKRLALTGIAAMLLALPAGCGAGGSSNADICTEAAAALDAFNAAIANVKVDDTATWEGKAKELSGKLGEIAGKTDDAQLKGVLLAMSTTWANFKLDGNDPASMEKSVKLVSEQPAKLGQACA